MQVIDLSVVNRLFKCVCASASSIMGGSWLPGSSTADPSSKLHGLKRVPLVGACACAYAWMNDFGLVARS
jgi:hypothetical protein